MKSKGHHFGVNPANGRLSWKLALARPPTARAASSRHCSPRRRSMHPTSRSLLPFFLAESPVARTVAVEGEAAMGKGLGEVATPSASSVRATTTYVAWWLRGRGSCMRRPRTARSIRCSGRRVGERRSPMRRRDLGDRRGTGGGGWGEERRWVYPESLDLRETILTDIIRNVTLCWWIIR